MYCFNCGKQVDGSPRYCPHCGADLVERTRRNESGGGGKSPWRVIVIAAVAVLVVAVAFFALLVGGREETLRSPAATPTRERVGPVIGTMPVTEPEVLPDGWYTDGGERYYVSDGAICVGLQEIDGEAYYFDDDGVLVVSEDVDYNGIILHIGADGCLNALTITELYGSWSDESYHFGNNGTSSILELDTEVVNCDRFRFCLEASGLHGAKVNGTWKVYIRSGGRWVHAQDISYTQPEGAFDIRFDELKTFDAITAYPTVQGNASYSSWFYLEDVHMVN